jgi:hypothetical protein
MAERPALWCGVDEIARLRPSETGIRGALDVLLRFAKISGKTAAFNE